MTQSRSPFNSLSTYSPSSITGNVSMGANFSTIGSISSNIGSSLGTTLPPSSSIQLTPTLTDEQIARLTSVAER